MGRCKSAPDRFAAIPRCRPDLSSKMKLDEIESTAEQKEAKWAPTTTLWSTMGSRAGSRALGQGAIDQYFLVRIKDERVEMAQLPCSASSTRPSTSTSPRRPDPPSSTTISTRRKIDVEPNVAEQRDDAQNDSRSKDLDAISRSSPSSQDSAGGTNATSSAVQDDPGDDKSKTCEYTITNNNSTKADTDGTETISVCLLKKAKYSTRLSIESKHVGERRSRSSIHVPPPRMPYSCRTVLIPPGKVGAVLHTSPLGPAIKSIKEDSHLIDQVAVGDVVVEVDGIDTTSARAKEVTMMLINGAERERQIVVLSRETLDQEDDESIIEEDSPGDRYLGFHHHDGDDDEAIFSASIASRATVAAGNTQAHNYKRAQCRENLSKKQKLSTNVKIRVDPSNSTRSIKGAHSVREGSAEEPTIWEAPERSMDAKPLTSRPTCRKSAVMGEEVFLPAPPSELTADRSSLTPKAVQAKKFDSSYMYDDGKGPFFLSPTASTTGSEISSLSGSLECSQFGDNFVIGSIVHDEHEKVPLSPIGEESTCKSHHDQGLTLGQDTHDQEILLIIGEHESNGIAGEQTQPGFDLFLPKMGEETSASFSTLTPSLADRGGGEQTDIDLSIDKLGEPLILNEPENWHSQPPGEESIVADVTVLVASAILSSGETREIAKRAADSVLSLCSESPTCIDFQSLASSTSLEILEAGGSQKCASAVVGAILTYQKEKYRQEGFATSTNSLVPLPLKHPPVPSRLDIISAKPLVNLSTEYHRSFQGTKAVVSSLFASRDQIVKDAFSSLLQQSTENFSANILAPRSTGGNSTSSTCSAAEETESIANATATFNPNPGSSQVGIVGNAWRSFSTYQLCCRTLIAAEGDAEVELFFPFNESEQLDLDPHVCVDQQDVPAEISSGGLKEVKRATCRACPTKSFATAPIHNGASRSTCDAFPDAEIVPRSLLKRWRSARRRQKAKRGRQDERRLHGVHTFTGSRNS